MQMIIEQFTPLTAILAIFAAGITADVIVLAHEPMWKRVVHLMAWAVNSVLCVAGVWRLIDQTPEIMLAVSVPFLLACVCRLVIWMAIQSGLWWQLKVAEAKRRSLTI